MRVSFGGKGHKKQLLVSLKRTKTFLITAFSNRRFETAFLFG